jgi:hypothetical protein
MSTAPPVTGRERRGALAYQDEEGQWHMCNPNELMFSTVTMIATHYWDDGWKIVSVVPEEG